MIRKSSFCIPYIYNNVYGIFLFSFSGLRGVERAESEGEASERHIREAGLFKHLRHFLGLRERLHGGGEVGVGVSIAGAA